MATVIDTPSYTLTVYSGKEELEKLADPASAATGNELAVGLEKAGLSPTGLSESSALGMLVEAKDADGNLVRVKVERK